jgi:hypothetical protein
MFGRPYAPIPNTESSLKKQAPIGRVFTLANEGGPEYKQAVYDAYKRQMPEHVGDARDYDELVAKAYQQFQSEGLVVVQRGVGMFVAPGAAEALRAREREAFLVSEWPEIRARMRRLHLDPARLLAEPERT